MDVETSSLGYDTAEEEGGEAAADAAEGGCRILPESDSVVSFLEKDDEGSVLVSSPDRHVFLFGTETTIGSGTTQDASRACSDPSFCSWTGHDPRASFSIDRVPDARRRGDADSA